MAVDPTRSLPHPLLAESSPTATAAAAAAAQSAAKNATTSFRDALKRSEKAEKPAAAEKSPRVDTLRRKDDKPIDKKDVQEAPQPEPTTKATDTTEPAPVSTEATQTATTAPTPEQTITEESEAAAADIAAQEAAAAIGAIAVLPLLPRVETPTTSTSEVNAVPHEAPPIEPQGSAAAVVAPPTVPVLKAKPPGPIPSVPQIAPVASDAAANPTPEVFIDAESDIGNYCSTEPPPETSPVTPQAITKETTPAPPVKAPPPTEESSSATVVDERVELPPEVKPLASKAYKKDEREEPKDDESNSDLSAIPVNAVTEVPVSPTQTDTTGAKSGMKSSDSAAPPPDAPAATPPPVDAPPRSDTAPTSVISGDIATSSKFPPGLAGRTSHTRETTARPDVDTTRFLRRVVGAFQAAEERGGDVKLRLRPPELGVVQVQIKIQDGVLTARLDAETPAARDLLLDSLPQLRERLAEQGMRIEKFDVNVSERQSGGTPDSGPQSRDEQQQQSPRPTTPRIIPPREDSTSRPQRGSDASGLNVLV